MKSKIEYEIHLILTREEAAWLKDQMQNPLHNQRLEQESEKDNKMRATFYEFLSSSLR
jgi:hypothetical protein